MPYLKQTLQTIFSNAITACLGDDYATTDPLIQIAGRTELGDYQANFALSLSKKINKPPLDIAQRVALHLQSEKIFEALTVSGPGFINIRISCDFLNQSIEALLSDLEFTRLKTPSPKTLVIDYGSANVAKEMHVGHLRSAIIGDCLVHLFDLLGHTVIKQNHVGDWGTQFGMLIEYLIEKKIECSEETISELNQLYKTAKAYFDESPAFADRARRRVVLLQAADEESLTIWKTLVTQSERYFQSVYQQLNVSLQAPDIRGESFYNPLLPGAIDELLQQKLAVNSEGAVVIELPHFVDENNQPLPLLIRKSDGAYLYASTDLVAARFRMQTLKATHIIYVTDLRQKLHFQMLFAALKKIGWANESVTLDHLAFGTILGENKKPFKTRSGETIRLVELITEAEKRATDIILKRHNDLTPEEIKTRAHAIGIGALKYADLSSDLVKDYVFNWDQLLAFEGNTAPYLQNAYVRIAALFRKGDINLVTFLESSSAIQITALAERQLALKIVGFFDVVKQVSEELRPHKLCTYLYELAESFHAFYERCPVLNNPCLSERNTRLKLSFAAAHILKTGLALLGIQTLEKM